ncbi:MAG: hypothetical protein H7247_07790 [Polaromonas sp.]|nr:hypothetical protein [Gemmatimonadaceae bacterium]
MTCAALLLAGGRCPGQSPRQITVLTDAIVAALQAKIVDVLITDRITAEALARQARD